MNSNAAAVPTIPFSSEPRVLHRVLLLLVLLTAALWVSSRAILSANFLPHWYCFAGALFLQKPFPFSTLLDPLQHFAVPKLTRSALPCRAASLVAS